MAFLIIILIIAQLVSFYLIILLNAKVSKFKELEVRQDKLIREMDDAIGAYLMEMREENDRLIKELSNVEHYVEKSDEILKSHVVMMDKEDDITSKPIVEEPPEIDLKTKIIIPKTIAKKAYGQQQNVGTQPTSDEQESSTLSPFEQNVLNLYKDGKTIEEIAKITQKGKTEIELLIKFHS